jgi:hypothetical protein
VKVLPRGSELHRNHLARFRSAEFNPGLGAPTRFAPFVSAAGDVVPSLYAAGTAEAAAWESIFHEVDPRAAFKTVRQRDVEARAASRVAPRRDLRLVQLFRADLAAWRLDRDEFFRAFKSQYAETTAWAQAIHRAAPDVDGLIWTSYRCDPETAMIFFGDRISEGDFDVLEQRVAASDADLLLEIREYGRRAGITLVS